MIMWVSDVDYLVIGVGVMGMVFIDVLMMEIDVIVVIVDCYY